MTESRESDRVDSVGGVQLGNCPRESTLFERVPESPLLLLPFSQVSSVKWGKGQSSTESRESRESQNNITPSLFCGVVLVVSGGLAREWTESTLSDSVRQYP